MVLGGVDQKYYVGDFTYVDVIDDTYYIVPLGGVSVNNRSYNVPNMQAIIDTGTSLIVGPTEWMNEIMGALPTNVTCSDIPTYPDIVFTLGGTPMRVTA